MPRKVAEYELYSSIVILDPDISELSHMQLRMQSRTSVIRSGQLMATVVIHMWNLQDPDTG
jgi:hypothetical protein